MVRLEVSRAAARTAVEWDVNEDDTALRTNVQRGTVPVLRPRLRQEPLVVRVPLASRVPASDGHDQGAALLGRERLAQPRAGTVDFLDEFVIQIPFVAFPTISNVSTYKFCSLLRAFPIAFRAKPF